MKKLILFLLVSGAVRAESPAMEAVELAAKDIVPLLEKILVNKPVARGILKEEVMANPAVARAVSKLLLTSGQDLESLGPAQADQIFRKELAALANRGSLAEGLERAIQADTIEACVGCGKIVESIGARRVSYFVAGHPGYRAAVRGLQKVSPELKPAELLSHLTAKFKDGTPLANAARFSLGAKKALSPEDLAAAAALEERSLVLKGGAGISAERKSFVDAVFDVATDTQGIIRMAPGGTGRPKVAGVVNVGAIMSAPLEKETMVGWTVLLQQVKGKQDPRAELQKLLTGMLEEADSSVKNEVKAALSDFKANGCFGIF